MRFFETDRAVSRATRQCTDTHPVRSVSFHPLGDHLLVGTGHSALHVYDVATFRCYTAARPEDNHTAPITCARWSADGALFAAERAGAACLIQAAARGRAGRKRVEARLEEARKASVGLIFRHPGRRDRDRGSSRGLSFQH